MIEEFKQTAVLATGGVIGGLVGGGLIGAVAGGMAAGAILHDPAPASSQ